jgi:hypothetical protein
MGVAIVAYHGGRWRGEVMVEVGSIHLVIIVLGLVSKLLRCLGPVFELPKLL